MLVNPKAMLLKARQEKRAIGAFNILNLETLQAVINAAETLKQDVICAITASSLQWAGFNYIVPMLLSAARNAKVAVAVHLDHCADLALIQKCIAAGFTSIMYDGSHLSIANNIQNAQQVLAAANNKVYVELEIGAISGKEDGTTTHATKLPTWNEIKHFYEATQPDALAIAFGTIHGLSHAKVALNLPLIQKAQRALPIPLVMHGTSGIAFKTIQAAIQSGITKVNVGTDLLVAYQTGVKMYLQNHTTSYDLRTINRHGMRTLQRCVETYLRLFNGPLNL